MRKLIANIIKHNDTYMVLATIKTNNTNLEETQEHFREWYGFKNYEKAVLFVEELEWGNTKIKLEKVEKSNGEYFYYPDVINEKAEEMLNSKHWRPDYEAKFT